MRKPLGRLAGAVLAGAVIAAAAAPTATAETTASPEPVVTTPSVPDTESSAPSQSPSSMPSGTATAPTSVPAGSSAATTTPTTTASVPGTSSAVTSTSAAPSSTPSGPASSPSSEPDGPQEPPYVDNVGYGVDLGNGTGIVIIACAAAEPTGLSSPDFEVVDGPFQDETDGRYWGFVVELRAGVTFADAKVSAGWTCGGTPPGGGASGGGAPVTPVPGSGDATAWQAGNGGKAQVAFAPTGGVETGFGATAQG